MARFTASIKDICEVLAGLDEPSGGSQIDELITQAIPKIFDGDRLKTGLEFIDAAFLNQLFYKILAHYYFEEIAYETYALWRHRINTKLGEILPYYDQLQKTILLKYNLLDNVDYTLNHQGSDSQTSTENRTSEGTSKDDLTGKDAKTRTDATKRDGTSSGTNAQTTTDTGTVTDEGRNSGNATDLHSDTPQGGVFVQDVAKHNYLTDARTQSTSGTDANTRTTDMTDTVNGTTTGKFGETGSLDRKETGENTVNRTGATTGKRDTTGQVDATDEYVNHVVGLKGNTYVNLIKEFRENVINIDVMIIDELRDYFMGLWE